MGSFWNPVLTGLGMLLISLLYMRRRALGRDCQWGTNANHLMLTILATCRACSTKVLLDSSRVRTLENAKIGQAKEQPRPSRAFQCGAAKLESKKTLGTTLFHFWRFLSRQIVYTSHLRLDHVTRSALAARKNEA